jgi:hypothetical protein
VACGRSYPLGRATITTPTTQVEAPPRPRLVAHESAGRDGPARSSRDTPAGFWFGVPYWDKGYQ